MQSRFFVFEHKKNLCELRIQASPFRRRTAGRLFPRELQCGEEAAGSAVPKRHVAAVRSHDLPDDQQPKAVARLLRAVVAHHVMRRVAQLLELFIRNADAVVLHREDIAFGIFPDGHRDRTSRRVVGLRVVQQVVDRPAQQGFIPLYHTSGQVFVRLPVQRVLAR